MISKFLKRIRNKAASKGKNFKETLHEAGLYAFGKILAKCNAFAQASILRDVGKEILEYLRKRGFDYEESGDLEQDLRGVIDLFVGNGFAREVKAEPAERGVKYTWIGLYGARAYEELQSVAENPFLSCPLNAVLHSVARGHEKILNLIEKRFDLGKDVVVSQEELVDAVQGEVGAGPGLDPLLNENAKLYALAEERSEKLQHMLNEMKTLRALLPICVRCKKIRDDEGYWSELETYFLHHSEIKFSHSLCPECLTKLYPGYTEQIGRENE